MQLTPNTTTQKLGRERSLLGGFLLLFAVGLIALFWRRPIAAIPSTPDRIACDAERQRGDHFFNGDFKFQGANYQSSQQARSGSHSMLLPADGNTHYGFTIILEQARPGEVYEVYVWSYNNLSGTAKLTVQGRDPSGLYLESSAIEDTDDAGWNLHKLRFHIPFHNSPKQLSIYVYNNGSEAVYFDDLLIKKVDLWQASDFEPKRLHLRLDPAALQQLSNKRDEALRRGLLINEDNDWVNAQLQSNEDSPLDAKVRLKGDWLDHLRGNKWSYRIKLKGSGAWEGLRTFSLHSPAARYYLHEWLLHQWWAEQGVLQTRYDFVELIVNGKSRGIYAYEEHFEKQLVESQERREGPIVKFSEEGFWSGIARQLDHHGFVRPNSGLRSQDYGNAPAAAFNETELLADTLQAQYWQQAQVLLEQYRSGIAMPNEVFELNQLARYYAGCDLLNAYHGIVWHNQRFYYNPLLGKLEPIGFDGFSDRPSARFHFLAEGALHPAQVESTALPASLMQDTAFIAHYLQVLAEESEPQRWQAFVARHEGAWTARLSWLQLEFPDYTPALLTIAQEVAFVRAHLLPIEANCLRSYRNKEGYLQLNNTHSLPLKVLGYGQTDQHMSRELMQPFWLPAGPVRKLRSKLQQEVTAAQFKDISFWNEQALAQQTTPYFTPTRLPAAARYLYFKLPGWDSLLVAPVNESQPPNQAVSAQAYRQASRAEDFPSLRWNEQAKQIRIPSGQHQLAQDLVIPTDYELQIAAGAEIDLLKKAAIISYGPVVALGEAERAIQIYTSDGTGQGLQVIQAPRASILSRVIFTGLRNLHKGSWQLTGAVTFIESAVQIVDCVFTDNQSEDALNLVRSRFEIENSVFQHTSSDGLDSDFCKGIIRNCRFLQTTNDGLDCSGSIVTISDSYFEACGDKGISAGEASDLTVLKTHLKACPIGIAAKDESTVHARQLRLSECEQGLVAFQKKPEFGPAYLVVDGLETEKVERLYQIGPGSRLQIDQEVFTN